MEHNSARLTLVAPDRVCREPGWQGTTNAVHAILHGEGTDAAEVAGLLPRWQSQWGLSIQAPYAPPRQREDEFETLKVILKADGTDVRPYKLGASSPPGPCASAPLTTIAEGVKASAFFLLLGEGGTGPVRVTARVVSHGIILAEAGLEIPTGEMGGHEVVGRQQPAFTRIFVSYAREDLWVVKLVDSAVSALGVVDFRWDLKILRPGDDWADVIREEIRSADSFQLFWSRSAARSPEVRKEWALAIEQEKERFIRPVYWRDPLAPKPPRELNHLHFALIEIPERVMPAAAAARRPGRSKRRAGDKINSHVQS